MRIMSAIAKSRFDRMACVKARCDLEGILVSMSTKIALSRVDRMGPAVHAITRDSLTCLDLNTTDTELSRPIPPWRFQSTGLEFPRDSFGKM